MYRIRVLIGGDIFVIRISDKVSTRYKSDGFPVHGSANKLGLDPNQVISIAKDAEFVWFSEYLHGVTNS